jgi:nitrate reductase gamma subunit
MAMAILPIWAYLALTGFVLGCLYKAYHYATMPMHVRWELYPVAHEKGKVAYGGSYFEELDWWTKPREVSKLGEVKTIAEEVLTLKAVREHNPTLWLPSLFFHFGLYLLFALGAVLLAGGLARYVELPGLGFLAGGRFLSAWGAVALALGTAGCVGLLARRLGRPQLRNASTPADFLHLWLLLAVFLASWGSWVWSDRHYEAAASFAGGLMTLQPVAVSSGWFAAQVTLLGVFLAYLPWSHMTHMFAKYFTWHSVRWDDAPNLGGEVYQAKVQKLLALPISWSAPHIRGGKGKRWVDVVQERGES